VMCGRAEQHQGLGGCFHSGACDCGCPALASSRWPSAQGGCLCLTCWCASCRRRAPSTQTLSAASSVPRLMHFDELKELGNEHAVKAAGKYRQEGKNYTVLDWRHHLLQVQRESAEASRYSHGANRQYCLLAHTSPGSLAGASRLL